MGTISLQYLLLATISMIVVQLLPIKCKNIILLLFSVLFLLSYGFLQTFVILSYVLLVYCLGKFVNSKSKLMLSIFVCLFPLLIYKYFINAFTESVSYLFSILGISFLCFRGISYLVDCFKKEIKNVKFLDYCLYMLFFPSYISGPIEQLPSFLKNIRKERINWNDFVSGIIIVLYGLCLKMIIADRLIGIINAIYNNYEIYTRYNVFSIIAYPIYIYCDFAGYSYIATGTSKLLGVKLTDNFKQPYFSLSVREFWNRWHISLNNWFKKYVYIPLGGNRKGELRKYINILIVFIISGIWHGNTMGFVLWGLINGLYQIVGELTSEFRLRIYEKLGLNNSFLKQLIKTVSTYILISITWVFFSKGAIEGIGILKSLFMFRKMSLYDFALSVCAEAQSSIIEIVIIGMMCLFVFVVDFLEYKGYSFSIEIPKKNTIIRYAVVLFLIVAVIMFGKYGSGFDSSNFVYFDF